MQWASKNRRICMNCRILCCIITLITILFVGCTKESDQHKSVYYRTIDTMESIQEQHDDVDEATARDNSAMYIEDERSSQSDSDSLYKHAKIIDIPDLFGSFSGIQSDSPNLKTANESINLKQGVYISPVCPGEDGITYYVNWGKDYYIYQSVDGIDTLVLDTPANFIQYWNGYLYFTRFEEGKHEQIGIYRYHMATKELTQISDHLLQWLYINEEGIYYNRLKPDEQYPNRYSAPLCLIDSNNNYSENPMGIQFSQYKDYRFNWYVDTEQSYMTLKNKNDSDSSITFPNAREFINTGSPCIYNNYLYYIGSDEYLYNLNLETGEYNVLNAGTVTGSPMPVLGYTQIGDVIYFTTLGRQIYSYHLLTKELVKNKNTTRNYIGDREPQYTELYTSHGRLFVLRSEDSYNTNAVLVEVILSNGAITEKELGL